MALYFVYFVLSLIFSSALCSPLNIPFEVYGPPPVDRENPLPLHIEDGPINIQFVTPSAPVGEIVEPEVQVPDVLPIVEEPQIPEVNIPYIPNQEINLPDEPQVSGEEFSPKDIPDHEDIPHEQNVEPEPNIISPGDEPQVVSIQDKSGQYSFGVNQPGPDGQVLKEQGRLITTNDGWEYVIAKKGSYAYTSPEGIPVTIEWEADHHGFRIIKSSV